MQYYTKEDSPKMLSAKTRILFSKKMMLQIKNGSEETTNSSIKVDLLENSEGPRTELTLRLSSEKDLELLLLGLVTQESFYKMKREQNLRVEFSDFARKLEELLALCETSMNEENVGEPKKVHHKAILEMWKDKGKRGAELRIVQENEFRESDHIVLEVFKASEKYLIRHLSNCLRVTKDIKVERERDCEKLNEELMVRNGQIRGLEASLRELSELKHRTEKEMKTHTEQQLSLLEKEWKQKMKAAKDIWTEQETELSKQATESSIQEGQLKRHNFELTDKLSNLEREYNQLTENTSVKVAALERLNGQLSKERESLQNQNKSLISQVDKLKTDKNEISAENRKNEALVHEAQELKLEARKITDTYMKLGKNQENLINDLRKEKEKLERKLIESAGEIREAERILQSMQSKNENRKQKTKNLQMLLKEEKEMSIQIKSLMAEKEKLNVNLKKEKENLTKNIEEKEILVKELRDRIIESDKQLEINGETIKYLNSRLEENQRPFMKATSGNRQFRGIGLNTYNNNEMPSYNKYGRFRSRDVLMKTYDAGMQSKAGGNPLDDTQTFKMTSMIEVIKKV